MHYCMAAISFQSHSLKSCYNKYYILNFSSIYSWPNSFQNFVRHFPNRILKYMTIIYHMPIVQEALNIKEVRKHHVSINKTIKCGNKTFILNKLYANMNLSVPMILCIYVFCEINKLRKGYLQCKNVLTAGIWMPMV